MYVCKHTLHKNRLLQFNEPSMHNTQSHASLTFNNKNRPTILYYVQFSTIEFLAFTSKNSANLRNFKAIL